MKEEEIAKAIINCEKATVFIDKLRQTLEALLEEE